MNFSECDGCGWTRDEAHLTDGLCAACDALENGGETVEVPVAVLKRLMSTAESRHPTACNEDAPMLRNVLVRHGYPLERDQ